MINRKPEPIFESIKDFLKCYISHMNLLNKIKYRNSTMLASYIHNLKLQNINYNLSWSILDRLHLHNTFSGRCQLCLKGSLLILHSFDLE